MDSWSPKRYSASVLASSVLPTPVGPRKTNEPEGRFGSLMPAKVRRMERETALMASVLPDDAAVQGVLHLQEPRGLLLGHLLDRDAVHIETISAISFSPMETRSPRPCPRARPSRARALGDELALGVAEAGGLLELLAVDGGSFSARTWRVPRRSPCSRAARTWS
jgi:hypothetical protein